MFTKLKNNKHDNPFFKCVTQTQITTIYKEETANVTANVSI